MTNVCLTGNMTDEIACKCDDCGTLYIPSELDDIVDVQERLDPGAEVPAGQCPNCGALAYLVDNPYKRGDPVIEVSGGLVQSVTMGGESVSYEVHDYDTEGSEPDSDWRTDADGTPYILFRG